MFHSGSSVEVRKLFFYEKYSTKQSFLKGNLRIGQSKIENEYSRKIETWYDEDIRKKESSAEGAGKEWGLHEKTIGIADGSDTHSSIVGRMQQ